MRKVIFLSALIALFFNCAFSQEMSKEEKKRLKDELKIYMADLQGYKAHKDDIQITLDSNEAQIKTLKEKIISQSDMRNQIESYENQLKDVRTENTSLKNFNDEKVQKEVAARVAKQVDSIMRTMPQASGDDWGTDGGERISSDGNSGGAGATKSSSTKSKTTKSKSTSSTGSSSPSSSASSSSGSSTQNPNFKRGSGNKSAAETNTPTEGTIYKIQLGLYKKFNINKYFEDLKYIGYERVDGKNRYVIGYFNDEQIAQNFVEDIRKMGIKDAFVSKYVDGVRVYETK